MDKNISILIIEDSEDDTLLLLRELRRSGYDPMYERVYTAQAMEKSLEKKKWDLILCDYDMPQFDALRALNILNKNNVDIPLIIVSGAIGEDIAVEAMRAGARDYIIKGNFSRLVPAIERELREVVIRKAGKKAEHRVKKTEAELKATSLLLDTIFNVIPDVIGLQDENHRIICYNDAGYKFLNKTYEEVKGKRCFELLGRDKPCEICATSEVYKSAKPARLEKYIEEMDMWLETSAYPITDETGKVIKVVEHLRDITERIRSDEEKRKLEARLRQAHKIEAIGTLAGGIAHDFNNILGAIMGYTDLAINDINNEELAKTYLSHVLKAGNRAKELVRQILSFSRQSEQKRKPLKIKLLLEEVIELIKPSLSHNIEIHTEFHDGENVIMADATQIHQVFMNLCTNALHSMKEKGGILEVTLDSINIDLDTSALYQGIEPGSYGVITFTDTGYGIDYTIIDRIFDPYFTTKEFGVGTGMGLAVVHGIVQSHGGSVKVYSKLAMGTTFQVYLPLVSLEAMEEVKVEFSPAGGKERILFVDDEEDLCFIAKVRLEKLGYRIITVTQSPEALNVFKKEPDSFDLVITDQSMPKLKGMELAEKILEVRPSIPIILCTGFSESINREEATEQGIREFIMKPFDVNEMAGVIRKVIREVSHTVPDVV